MSIWLSDSYSHHWRSRSAPLRPQPTRGSSAALCRRRRAQRAGSPRSPARGRGKGLLRSSCASRGPAQAAVCQPCRPMPLTCSLYVCVSLSLSRKISLSLSLSLSLSQVVRCMPSIALHPYSLAALPSSLRCPADLADPPAGRRVAARPDWSGRSAREPRRPLILPVLTLCALYS